MLKEKVKEVMAKQGISFLELERQTGIPSNRMYKWYQQGTQPKAEDAEKLKTWLSGMDKYTNEGKEPIKGDNKLIDTILDLTYTGRKTAEGIDKMADANLINARSIETLVAILASNLGVSALKGLSLEALQTGDIPAEAFLGGQPIITPKDKTNAGKSHKTDKKGN